jgi:lysyl-tRNA synthetase class II
MTRKFHRVSIAKYSAQLDYSEAHKMTQTVFVKFSYEDRVSEEVPIQVKLDLTKNSNRRKLLDRLLKSNPNITEVTLLS